jgi:hypothetical protein
MPIKVSTVDPGTLSAQFFELIRKPTLDQALLESTREHVKSLCPEVEHFSFELVDEAEAAPTATADEGKSEKLATVEAGTPSSTITAWNSVKLVSLVEVRGSDSCGAAIGSSVKVSVLDFKACLLPVEGEEACPYSTHRGKSVARMQFTTGGYDLAIPVPMSTAGRPVQVFSRPLLTEDDLYYMGPGTLGFARLLTIKLEPRVWKILIERFPGRDALRGPNQKPPAAASAAAANATQV